MIDEIFYVYQYVTEQNVPYYVGKGCKSRIREKHYTTTVPDQEFRQYVKTGLTEKEAYDLGTQLIKQYGRKIDGGLLDNIKLNRWACTSGWNHSEETKQKISEKNTGKIRTLEQRENYRKPKSAEHVEKIRQANLGRKNDGRYSKVSETKSKQRWYTNGSETRMFVPGSELAGFAPGRGANFGKKG